MSEDPTCSKFSCFDVEEDSEDDNDDGDDIDEVDSTADQFKHEMSSLISKITTKNKTDKSPTPTESDHSAKNSKGRKRKESKSSEDANNDGMKKMRLSDDDSDTELVITHKDVIKEVTMEAMENRVTVTTVETLEACTHEVANPPNCQFEPLIISTQAPAKTYPFILDPFQKEAILCIDNNQSVLVSAHTSAGKTVVAEYAIASSLRDNQRVIYTTPIKALSNQKYREFNEEFKDVGLITGDVTINPDASCLIMTTEILRNMLYRGSEVTREVGWVVFDEIHYMRDKERGVVWEETIILLPHNVHFVFLSATIPNARQFAEWVCTLHEQPCHVVYTDYRPTPLQHFIYPSGGDGIHLVVDEKGSFRENNFNAAMALLQASGDNAKVDRERGRRGGMKRNAENTNVYQVVKMIMERNFAPVIVFSFSKKDCELYAMQMMKLDFNTVEEKKLVDEVFNNAMDVLKPEDKKIPQIENVLPFLRRGIGIHHGGLLPILKETIEILFAEGLIKALFATETFAMGLNMPARTVVFTNMRKFDGKEYRWITSGEYIQMAGRAGRRGLDDKGIVISMIDEKVTPAVGRSIVQGQPDPINSAFQLTYTMVLNLLRVDDINPEYMMERSFYQFQSQSTMPDYFNKYEELRKKYHEIVVPNYQEMKLYHELKKSIDKYKNKCRKFIYKPMNIIPFLKSGRMIKVKYEETEFDWGIMINFKRNEMKGFGKKSKPNNSENEIDLTLDVLLHVEDNETVVNGRYIWKPCPSDKVGIMEVITVPARNILEVSSVRVHLPEDLRSSESRLGMLKILLQVKTRFQDSIPLLDPIKDMNINDPKFLKLNQELETFVNRLPLLPISQDPNVEEIYTLMLAKIEARKAMREARVNLSKVSSILQLDELKNRKRVLRRLQFCDDSDIIQIKGRVACELSGADELLLTEMIFNGLFDKLSPELAVSLLSCMVCDEKAAKGITKAEELSSALRNMQHIARNIARISRECSIDLKEDDYIEKFKPSLMDVVHAWCKGSTFLDICKMTDIYEGSIIRTMRRLEELLRQLCQASKGIGNTELETKFAEGIRLIKRDIVFAASLYL